MTQMNWKPMLYALGFAVFAAFAVGPVPGFAQEKKPATKKAAPAAKKAAPAGKAPQKSAWVKLCEKVPIPAPPKSGEENKEPQKKNICITKSEQLDQRTGLPRVSAGIRQVEGSDKQSLMALVPLGMAIPPGLGVVILTQEQWGKFSKKEKLDRKQLKEVRLKYSHCLAVGCWAEVEAGNDVLESLKKGALMMILPMTPAGREAQLIVPLVGFTAAYSGKPADMKKYAEARRQLIAQIRARQQEAAKAYQEVNKIKKPGEAAAGSKAPPNKK